MLQSDLRGLIPSATFVMARLTCVLLVEPPVRALWPGVFLTRVTIKTSRRTPCPRQGLPPRLPGLTKLLNMRPGPRKAPKVTPRQPGPDPQEGCGTWGSLSQNKNPADMPGLCPSRTFLLYTPSIRQPQIPVKNGFQSTPLFPSRLLRVPLASVLA